MRLGLATVLAITALAASAQAQTPAESRKLDPVLRQRARQLTGHSRVIVQFNTTPDVRVFGSSAAVRPLGERARVAEVDNRLLAAIAADPRVDRVMVDRVVFATLERTGAAVGATVVREELGVTGRGIGVAVIDSGVSGWHDDLYRDAARRERVVHFRDFARELPPRIWVSEQPHDDYGHGTHVAGVIAGSGYDSHGARRGIAPGAHLIALKVLDDQGHGYVSDVIAALDYAVAVRRAYNIRVINLSVASGVFESYWLDPLTLAAKRAVDAGIVVVAAAGNLGRGDDGRPRFGGITSPGNAPWVLTVGASSHQGSPSRADDVIAGFSSRGPTRIDFAAKPDLVAPGVGIESLSNPGSTLYFALSDYLLDGTRRTGYKPYLSLTGTSMAAPAVAATVALMLEVNPTLTPNAVKAILQFTAERRPAAHPLAQGAGLLNARGAVRLAGFFAAPDEPIEMADTIAGEPVFWSRHIIWGNYRVEGGMLLPGSNAWSLDLVWGALQTPSGAPVVWGVQDEDANIVWSTGDDENIVWSTDDDGNIVWSTSGDASIVWSTEGADEGIVWSTTGGDDAGIVWSTGDDENIVWSTTVAQNVVWGNDCGGRNCPRP
ncbi:MAG TPA: S8 family peptidase [Vicinamibacterales bacterium]|nr:S8 family peptidase [Vicinamibacterales bacterium]